MKKASNGDRDPDMLEEYDFTKGYGVNTRNAFLRVAKLSYSIPMLPRSSLMQNLSTKPFALWPTSSTGNRKELHLEPGSCLNGL